MVAIRTPQWQSLVEEKVAKETELGLLRTRWQMSISTIDCYKSLINRYVLNEMVIEENLELIAEKWNEYFNKNIKTEVL